MNYPKPPLLGRNGRSRRGLRETARADENRIDSEFAEFFGTDESTLFGVTHLPSQAAPAGVVIFSPLHAEFVRNYRREVLLARTLVKLGFAVQRFHYRGTGHSLGHHSQLSLDSMFSDGVVAAEHLVERAGTENLFFVGSRCGAFPAARLASKLGGAPLVTWDPFMIATDYFRNAFLALRIHHIREGKALQSMESLVAELEQRGTVDIFGYPISAELYRSLENCSPLYELMSVDQPVLVVQTVGVQRSNSRVASAIDNLVQRGTRVDTASVQGDEPWFLVSSRWQPQKTRAISLGLIEATTSWLVRQIPPASEVAS